MDEREAAFGGVCQWPLVVIGSTGLKKSDLFFLVCLFFFLPLAPYVYLILGTVLKSARPQPQFGLSFLACHAKHKSADFFVASCINTPAWRL